MTTPELRTPGAGDDLPVSPEELSRLASRLYAGPAPFQLSPPAPRGGVPDATAASAPSRPAAEAGAQAAPLTPPAQPWTEPSLAGVLPGPDSPPYTVPVAPRGSAPGTGAAAQAPARTFVLALPGGLGEAEPAAPVRTGAAASACWPRPPPPTPTSAAALPTDCWGRTSPTNSPTSIPTPRSWNRGWPRNGPSAMT